MPAIQLQNLTFAYAGSAENVFEDVSLRIDASWKLGLIGRNGRGKTTLLNLLLGKLEHSGTIRADVEFEYFPYQVQNQDEPAIDVAREIAPDLAQWELERELSLLSFDENSLYLPFSLLSLGERTKVLLATLFLRQNAFLLIDEPTNHLDAKTREAVASYLSRKSGFILVSHDRNVLDRCIDHVISINKAGIEVQQGNFTTWQANKDMRDSFELAENARLQKDIKRLKEGARRASDWSDKTEKGKKGAPDKGFVGHKAAKMMSKAKNIEDRQNKAVEDKSRLLKNLETAEKLKLTPLRYHKNLLAEAKCLSVRYDGGAIFEGLGFSVENGDRLALVGKNGCGKSTVLKLLLGEEISHEGELRVGSGLKISYVPQGTSHLSGGLREYAEKLGVDFSVFLATLRKLDFQRAQFEKNMEDLSEGQKKKVLIAGSVCEAAHLYVWDEPLNFIDVLSHSQIEDLITEASPTMVFVEHDQAFVDKIATKKVEFQAGRREVICL
jgi:lincosamide and streptogramin A transport system ATP-binding/permease protein